MNGTLGRDKLWSDQIWSDMDKAVRDEMGRVRVAQKVFPSTIANNVLPVSTNRTVPFGAAVPPIALGLQPDVFQPLLEISRGFALTSAQVEGEETTHTVSALARLAASAIAAAEDTVLFFGVNSIPLLAGTGVAVTNQAALPQGIVNEAVASAAASPPPVNVAGATPVFVGQIIQAVYQGIAALNARGQPGPYALFLSSARYAQTFAPPGPGMLQAPGDQLNHVVTGGLYMVNSLTGPPPVPPLAPPPPHDIGILVSLGGEPTKISLGTDAMTAFLSTDAVGNYNFLVFERIQLVVRDGRAFQTLQF